MEFIYSQSIDSLVLVDTGTDQLAVLRNQQWSVMALIDNATGSVEERYAYDHIGNARFWRAMGQRYAPLVATKIRTAILLEGMKTKPA